MLSAIEKVIVFAVAPAIIMWFITIIPAVEIVNKAEIISGIENIGLMLKSVNSFFPVNVFFQCLAVWILIYNIQLIMRFGAWLLRKLPLGIS